jgi:hypothetical protein
MHEKNNEGGTYKSALRPWQFLPINSPVRAESGGACGNHYQGLFKMPVDARGSKSARENTSLWPWRFADMILRDGWNSAITWRHAPQGLIGASVSATMAMQRKSLFPATTAAPIATRSAHIVSPKLKFSTLHPVKTVPSEHSRAAPTAKFE